MTPRLSALQPCADTSEPDSLFTTLTLIDGQGIASAKQRLRCTNEQYIANGLGNCTCKEKFEVHK